MSTPGQFGPVLLPQVNKDDDEELYFLKFKEAPADVRPRLARCMLHVLG